MLPPVICITSPTLSKLLSISAWVLHKSISAARVLRSTCLYLGPQCPEPSSRAGCFRRLPSGYGSRRSVESGKLPFDMYRQTLAGGWDSSEIPHTFKALQLQRFKSRMFWNAAGVEIGARRCATSDEQDALANLPRGWPGRAACARSRFSPPRALGRHPQRRMTRRPCSIRRALRGACPGDG